MQNKPNFQKSQMNISNIITRNYKVFIPLAGQKNKPNSNPIKPNLRKAKMDLSSFITKDYRKNDDFTVRINKPNSNPISEKPKMNANLYVIEDYENETAFRPRKTNPNKPNFKSEVRNQRSDICLLSWSLPPVQASLFLCRGSSVFRPPSSVSG